MKRGLDDFEISDDEWEEHSSSFKPSRVLKKPRTPTPPPIESFAFRASSPKPQQLSDDDDDCVEIKNELEDDDVDEVQVIRPVKPGRRFVIEDEESDGDWVNIESTSEEEEEEEAEELEEDDVVGKALQKCAKISADLRRELHGSSAPAVSDRYAEVEAASVRIVTQVLSIFYLLLFSILFLYGAWSWKALTFSYFDWWKMWFKMLAFLCFLGLGN